MNSKELVILSLINEHPSHGYLIEEKIDKRGMRNWTSIGFSSIYRLANSLEKKGFVKSKLVQEKDDARIKKIYSITSKGQEKLKESIVRGLTEMTKSQSTFDIALSNIWLVSEKEAIQSLEKLRKSLIKRREIMFDNWEKSGGKDNLHYLINALFEHGDVMSKAELQFVEDLIRKIKKFGIKSQKDK